MRPPIGVRIVENNAQLRTKNIIETEINMKRTLLTVAALVAFAGTQAFAQNTKEGVITFALTAGEQTDVSTSAGSRTGNWSQGPQYYTAKDSKKTTANVLKAIAQVLYHNGSAFSSKAQLVLVQGELGGFFNVGETLGNYDGPETDLALGNPNNGYADATDIQSTRDDLFAQLATGRHFRPNPIDGSWPVGHHQPWGQIFVKDPGAAGYSVNNPLCVNVTFFFGITVQECYDCWYLNSFISTAKFGYKPNTVPGPGCCGKAADLTGNGKDRYYMTLNFDNTKNNPYLNIANDAWIGADPGSLEQPNPWWRASAAARIVGMGTSGGLPGDGITPDLMEYIDLIHNGKYPFTDNVLRFTLNGVVTYTWTMKKINTTDLFYDFVGTANYPVSGYGFADLVCALYTGSVSIVEKISKNANCCQDLPWYNSWYGVGWNLFQDQWPVTAISGDSADGSYFATPVNIPEDISLHLGYNEWYEVRSQWPQSAGLGAPVPAGPESIIRTTVGSAWDSPYVSTRIPSARGWTDRSNTDWDTNP